MSDSMILSKGSLPREKRVLIRMTPQADHPLYLRPRDARVIRYLILYIFCNLLRLTTDWFNWSLGMLHKILDLHLLILNCRSLQKLLLWMAAIASEELTSKTAKLKTPSVHQIPLKRTLLIWLTVDFSLESKDAKSSILWIWIIWINPS